jgi:Na+/phosphate symporter
LVFQFDPVTVKSTKKKLWPDRIASIGVPAAATGTAEKSILKLAEASESGCQILADAIREPQAKKAKSLEDLHKSLEQFKKLKDDKVITEAEEADCRAKVLANYAT